MFCFMKNSLLPHCFPVTCHTDYVGKDSTFVAIKGMKEDGIAYIPHALERGAHKIVIEESTILSDEIKKLIQEKNAELIVVPHARRALAQLSAQALNYPARSLKIIAITGTKGKSTTAFLTEHILKIAGYRTALISTVKKRILDHDIPCELTTPQPDFLHVFFDACKKHSIDYVIMEVAAQGTSLYRVETLEFERAVFTNFSLEHSEFYENLDSYFAAKAAVFTMVKPSGTMIFNADDERVFEFYKNKGAGHTFGLREGATLRASIDYKEPLSLSATFFTHGKDYAIHAPALLGTFNVYNCLAAASLAHTLGIGYTVIQEAFLTFKGTPGRLERYMLPNGALGCIDYAHNPSSFEAILSTLRVLTPHLIVVFGAGGDRDLLKRPLMGALAARIADMVILTSDNPRSEDPYAIIQAIKEGIQGEDMAKVSIEIDREVAIKKAYTHSKKNSIIALLGKGPDEYQIIQGKKYPFSEAAILRSFQKHEIII